MSTRRRIEFELVGNAGNIEAVLNRLNTGITRTATGSRGVNRELSAMDRQLMAIRTTARYALAGGLVFGITGAISRLRDFQDRLAQVAALSGTVNTQTGQYNAPSAGFLNRVGDQALLMSNQLGIATEDVQDYMSRFFSAFDVNRMGGNEKLAQLRRFVMEVGSLQASLGAEAGDPQQLAGGIAGFVRQIDPSGRHIGRQTSRVSNLIWEMLAQTPNVTGRDISRDIGRVGATMQIARMTPEQVFAVWTQAGISGGSSSVIGRGVAQLLGTSLLHPTTPAQRLAFGQAGLPTDPTTLRNMGGFQVLQRMMQAVAPNGATVRNPNALNNEDLEDPDAIAASGVRGVNLTLLYNLLGRQESVRQFINLLANGAVPALRGHVEGLKRAEEADRAHAREVAAQRQRVLSQTAQAMANLPLQLVRQMRWPLEHILAPPLIGASNFAANHPRVTQATEAALGTALAGFGARRLIRAIGRGRGGLGAAAGAAITAEELPSILAGGSADGSRHNPFWVIIAPVSGTLNPGLEGGTHSDTTKSITQKLEGAVGKGGPWGAAAAAWLRGGGWRTLARGGARSAAEVTAAVEFQKQVVNRLTGTPQDQLPSFFGWNGQLPGGKGGPSLDTIMRKNGQTPLFPGGATFTGALDVTHRLVDAQGREISVDKKKGVPVKMIPDKGVPTSQGKSGVRKGSH